MPTYRYANSGLTLTQIQAGMPSGVVTAASAANPTVTKDITLTSSAYKADLDEFLAQYGYSYVEQDPQAASATLPVQRQKDVLDEDLGTHHPNDGWFDLASVEIQTKGGGTIDVTGSATATVLIGGRCRAVINGGSFETDTAVFSGDLPVLGAASFSYTQDAPIPATTDYTTYTVKLQAKAVGLLAQVTVDAESDPASNSATLICVEYK